MITNFSETKSTSTVNDTKMDVKWLFSLLIDINNQQYVNIQERIFKKMIVIIKRIP